MLILLKKIEKINRLWNVYTNLGKFQYNLQFGKSLNFVVVSYNLNFIQNNRKISISVKIIEKFRLILCKFSQKFEKFRFLSKISKNLGSIPNFRKKSISSKF